MSEYASEISSNLERAEDGNAWSHFRAPDGFVYELTYTPNHPSM